jgi:DNA-binding MltR family transcriptional regulator
MTTKLQKKKLHLPHLDRVVEFRESLNPETDRGCGVAAPAFIDEELKVLLKSVLADESKIIELAFSQSGPLASFSARIDFGLLMGLLSRAAWRDLHIIRRIRNDFAHSAKPLSFEDDAIRSRCSELSFSLREKDASPRQHFTSAVCAVLACIHGSLSKARRPVIPSDQLLSNEKKVALRAKTAKVSDEVLNSLPPDLSISNEAKASLHDRILRKALDDYDITK